MKNIIAFILLFSILIPNSFSQTTAIPDTIFELLLVQYGIDSDGQVNGQILNSDAVGVTRLDVNSRFSRRISDLSGIDAFVNLDTLRCSSNDLTSLDLTGNTVLRYLECSGNNMSNLDVSGNTLLNYLNCRYNNLGSVNLTANSALKHLECDVGGLTSLDLSANSLLEYVICKDNDLANLDVAANTAIEYLDCSKNNLTSLDMTTNLALENLICSQNNLISLNVLNNAALKHLDCNFNMLTNLDVSGNSILEHLNCGGNRLSGLNITANSALTALSCWTNNLTSLTTGTHAALEYLNCSGNNLVNLDASALIKLKWLYCGGNKLINLNVSSNDSLDLLLCGSNRLAYLYLPTYPPNVLHCNDNQPYLVICASNLLTLTSSASWSHDPTATYSESCHPLSVNGRVAIDDNTNCSVDNQESGLVGQVVKFEKTTDTTVFYFTTYDSLGNYRAYLDTGNYTVSVIPSSPYWQVCPSNQSVFIDTNYVVQKLDWSLDPLVSCPLLEVDISAPFLRMTGGGSAYTISYCNNGTVAAQNAYVEVDLDADLNYITSSIPVVSQSGTVYTFNLGTIDVGVCNSFYIQVIVDTSAQFEQTHCTEVHIYPDSICVPIWSGPIVDGNASCQVDSILFSIVNIGTGMLQPQSYTVIQDDIAMRTGTVQLGAGQSTVISEFVARGSTYRIEVEQATGFPTLVGDPIFSKAIEGCNPFPDGSFNTGFVTQFSNGYSAPFKAIDCQQNVASYDPNDKSAQPMGYGVEHYIEKNVPIDYRIRFQNTGTDTAFNIVIVDTLSPYVDIASLQMGASSHNYTWEVVDGNVLKLSFLDILLVDSNANEPLSHGFFRYRIEQKLNNPLGTVIENQAAIYFDYNPPIFTNTTFHTIGENFISSSISVDKIYEKGVEVIAFPNPFTHSTTIRVEGKTYEELELSIFDVTGRKMVVDYNKSNNQIQLNRGHLQAGIYIYELKGDNSLINTGKIIVQ